MEKPIVAVGETVHLWGGAGGRVVVPVEVTIEKITPTQVTVRNGYGRVLRFRSFNTPPVRLRSRSARATRSRASRA